MSAAHSHSHPDPHYIEPRLVSIPAAWFLMGSATGQDCERPVHRVWIDAFQLAATQVTNAEYAAYLRATGLPSPPFWNDPNFNDPQQPVRRRLLVRSRPLLPMAHPRKPDASIAFPPKPNGSAPPAAISNRKNSPGATIRRNHFPTTPPAGKPDPSP